MKQIRIGDITIDAVIEREGRWRRPHDFFPAYDNTVFKHHLSTMETEFFDAASGTARERSSVERDFPEHFDERPLKPAVHAR